MLAAFSFAAVAQSTMTLPDSKTWSVAAGNNLYCAGYIQSGAISDGNTIVGSVDEADKYNFSQNDFLYINMGANKGVSVGDTFAVVRPAHRSKASGRTRTISASTSRRSEQSRS